MIEDLTKITIQELEDILHSKSFSDDEIIKAETGEFGLLTVMRLIENSISLNFVSTTISKKDSNLDSTKQFVKYVNNNITFIVEHNPLFDIREDINKSTGFPKKSTQLIFK